MDVLANGTEIQPRVTTVGRVTGKAHTVQIRVYYWDGRLIATSPYPTIKRDWVPNVMANPEVTIAVGEKVVRARAKVVSQELEGEVKKELARHRIGWRTSHCPLFEPETDTFVEFFPVGPPEEIFSPEVITHSPDADPLPAASLAEVREWQKGGNWYQRRPS